jgi:hypothetical protein
VTAKEWRERARALAEAVPLTLPSGLTIRARRPGPLQYAAWDRLPLMLAEASEQGPESVTVERAQEIAKDLRELLVYCCLEPRVSETPGPEEIHPREMPEQDWMFIVSWAMRLREAAELRSFRGQRADGGADGDGEAVFVQTVEPAGDRGPGAGAGVRPGGGEAGGRGAGGGERG